MRINSQRCGSLVENWFYSWNNLDKHSLCIFWNNFFFLYIFSIISQYAFFSRSKCSWFWWFLVLFWCWNIDTRFVWYYDFISKTIFDPYAQFFTFVTFDACKAINTLGWFNPFGIACCATVSIPWKRNINFYYTIPSGA